MAIFGEQLRDNIIQPVLQKIGFYSLAAEQLLLGTCAVESGLGSYLVQSSGPALGIYQMEPATLDAIYAYYQYTSPNPTTSAWAACGYSSKPSDTALVYNLAYATVMCRLHYLRFPEPLPDSGNFTAMAMYWKKYYNTPLGAGTVDKFNVAYQKYVAPLYNK